MRDGIFDVLLKDTCDGLYATSLRLLRHARYIVLGLALGLIVSGVYTLRTAPVGWTIIFGGLVVLVLNLYTWRHVHDATRE